MWRRSLYQHTDALERRWGVSKAKYREVFEKSYELILFKDKPRHSQGQWDDYCTSERRRIEKNQHNLIKLEKKLSVKCNKTEKFRLTT